MTKRAKVKLSEQELIDILCERAQDGRAKSTSVITATKLLMEYRAGTWPKKPTKDDKGDEKPHTVSDELLARRRAAA